jgi:ubiquinone biosynthesis protein
LLERFAPQRVARRARRELLSYAQVVAEAPHQFHDFMEEIRDGQIEVGFVHKGLDDLLAKLDTLFNRLVIALIVVGGLIGSGIIGVFATTGPQVLGINVISIVGFACSAVLGIWLLWGVVRSGRL